MLNIVGKFAIWIILIKAAVSKLNGKNNPKKGLIEDIGCPYENPNQLLMENVCKIAEYHNSEPPENTEDGNTIVYFEFYSEPQVIGMDETKNKITILIHQYIEWEDPDIKAKLNSLDGFIKFPHDRMQMIWYPDRMTITEGIQHSKSLYDTTYSDIGLMFNPRLRNVHNSTTFYAYKDWEVAVFCQFEFSLFPFDIQDCQFRQFSDLDSVRFLLLPLPQDEDGWKTKALGFDIEIDIVGTFIGSNDDIGTNTTNHFGLDITLKRLIQPYFYQYYLPAMAIVVVSQVSFVIPLTAIPGRVALVVTQFLTLTNIFIHQMSNNPSGANLNALGIYLLVSLFFVLATMVEFAVVLVLARFYPRIEENKESNTKQRNNQTRRTNLKKKFWTYSKTKASLFNLQDAEKDRNVKEKNTKSINCSLTEKMDFVALFIFMFIYFLFNCVYFMHYM